MENMNFAEGYKELALNGDESRIIRFNPLDVNLMDRLKRIGEEINNTVKKYESKKKDITRAELEKLIKQQIDYALNSEGASEKIFNGQSPLSKVNGMFLFESFLMAFVEYVNKAVKEEVKKTDEKIKKYTEEYENDRQTT